MLKSGRCRCGVYLGAKSASYQRGRLVVAGLARDDDDAPIRCAVCTTLIITGEKRAVRL